MEFPQKSYIVLFKKIYLKDIREPPQIKTPAAADVHHSTENSVELPKIFTTVEEWPQRSTLRCWECADCFNTRPAFLPITTPDGIIPRGNFCGWGCAIKYLRLHYPKESRWDIEKQMIIIRSLFEGRPIYNIAEAPDRTRKKSFCGNSGLSNEEFEELKKQIDINHTSTININKPRTIM